MTATTFDVIRKIICNFQFSLSQFSRLLTRDFFTLSSLVLFLIFLLVQRGYLRYLRERTCNNIVRAWTSTELPHDDSDDDDDDKKKVCLLLFFYINHMTFWLILSVLLPLSPKLSLPIFSTRRYFFRAHFYDSSFHRSAYVVFDSVRYSLLVLLAIFVISSLKNLEFPPKKNSTLTSVKFPHKIHHFIFFHILTLALIKHIYIGKNRAKKLSR